MSLENHYEIICIKAFIVRELKYVRFSEQSVDVLCKWRKFTHLRLTVSYSVYLFLTISGERNSSFLNSLYSFTCSINYIFYNYFTGTLQDKLAKTNKLYSTSLICFSPLLPSSCWLLWGSNLPFPNLLLYEYS